MAEAAEKKSVELKAQALSISAAAWKQWVIQALEKGAGKAHRFTRGACRPPDAEALHRGTVLDTPEKIMDMKAAQWDQLWGRDREQEAALAKIQALRAPAEAQLAAWPPLTLAGLDRTIRATPVATGLDFDGLDPVLLRSLPPGGRAQLLSILVAMESRMILPAQGMLNAVALLDKPDGGDRPISLMCMLYRLLLRMRRPFVDAWDAEHAGPWDAAVKGSGALEAAYVSELETEFAVLEGKVVGGVLLDMAKFYDNMDLCCLADEAVAYDYPLPLLVRTGPGGRDCPEKFEEGRNAAQRPRDIWQHHSRVQSGDLLCQTVLVAANEQFQRRLSPYHGP